MALVFRQVDRGIVHRWQANSHRLASLPVFWLSSVTVGAGLPAKAMEQTPKDSAPPNCHRLLNPWRPMRSRQPARDDTGLLIEQW